MRLVRPLLFIMALVAQSALGQVGMGDKVALAARAQVGVTRYYDPSYVRLAYPMGDVPPERGVCSDVVVRAYRAAADVDFQRLLHEDMRVAFASYPRSWGLRQPDSNIDHRRVPNLQRFLERTGKLQAISNSGAGYLSGDIVSWRLPNGLAHIGIVSDRRLGGANGRPLVVHNIGRGAREEDVLFAWPQTGHYRWFPKVADR